MSRRFVAAALIAIAATACTHNTESDSLATGRKNLKPAPCSGTTPAVCGVAGVNTHARDVYLGDWVIVSVCHLEDLVKQAAAEQQPITLYMEGLDTGNQVSGIDIQAGTITFILGRDADNKKLWQPYLYGALFDETASIHVSCGIRGERALPRAEGANMTLTLHKIFVDWTVIVWAILLIAVMLLLLMFARSSDMLRDGPAIAGVKQSYSLGRTQMAWWFFLILVGYVYIWIITGDRDTIPASLLGLMGISAATALTAVAVSPSGNPRRKLLDDEIAAVDASLQQIAADLPAANDTVKAALLKKQAEFENERGQLIIERDSLTTIVPSEGIWKDLVTNEEGSVALDRFQVIVWTVVLGGVFLNSVLWDLTMPEFNATLLALMGISSGTYIGFKLPQQKGG